MPSPNSIVSSMIFMQLTNNSLGEVTENLSNLVNQSVESLVEQSTNNLDDISNTFMNVADYLNTSKVTINESVSGL